MKRDVAICGILLLAVAAVFGQTLWYGFVSFDDGHYVFQNPHVSGGLTADNIAWAFTCCHNGNWHPLCWLSLMADAQLYGLQPWGYHLTNVVLHGVAACLLYLVLQVMTACPWRSAFVAAVFAVHPLRAESVAWVTERKDVLSGVFFLLTLAAYLYYVRRPRSVARYSAVIAVFAMGLMAKPMLVTLPFVLLLLDYWPLNRMAAAGDAPTAALEPSRRLPSAVRLAWEKAPLFLLAAVSCEITLHAHAQALLPVECLSVAWRTGNALISYAIYLRQSFWPVGLACLYPRLPLELPRAELLPAIVLLLSITAAAILFGRKHRYLVVGWLWFLGMLFPVIGLMQVGAVSTADRLTYLPQIGLTIAVAWGTADLWRYWRWPIQPLAVASVAVLMALAYGAWRQTSYWADSETLWNRALACTANNVDAHFNLAAFLAAEGRTDEAMVHLREALEIAPDYAEAHNDLGVLCTQCGRDEEALWHYQRAVAINPDFPEAQNNLGIALAASGLEDDAALHYRKALALRPGYAEAHNNLGVVLANWGRYDEAIEHYQQALALKPDYANAHNNLGEAILAGEKKNLAEAIEHFRKALESDPGHADARRNLTTAQSQLEPQ